MTTMAKMYQEMNNFKVVKACIFKRNHEFATVLCTVPADEVGCDLRQERDGSIRPISNGTYIRALGRGLITPFAPMTLTNYERLLRKDGWEFSFTVKEARGRNVREGFNICFAVISVARKILR